MYKLFTPGSDTFSGFVGWLVKTKLVFIQTLIFLEGIKSVLGQGGQIFEWPSSVLARRQIVQDCGQNLLAEADDGGDDEHEDDGPQAPPEDRDGAQTQSWPVTDRPEVRDVEYVMVKEN